MTKINLVILFMTLLVTNSSFACAFDEDYYNQSYYSEKKGIKYFSWINTDKTAKIETDSGELLSIKHWSCNHIGLHAVMLVGPYSDDNFSNIKKYLISLASITLEKPELKLILDQLNKKPITLESNSKIFNIKDNQYSEFYFKYTVINESLIVEIKFYKS